MHEETLFSLLCFLVLLHKYINLRDAAQSQLANPPPHSQGYTMRSRS